MDVLAFSAQSMLTSTSSSRDDEPPYAPPATHKQASTHGSNSAPTSNAAPSAVVSPNDEVPVTSPLDEEREAAVQRDFDQGGIKLKKKASSNFGAPFGSLGGFGSIRRPS